MTNILSSTFLQHRLIVNHTGKHVGKGFVEFASAKEAENVRVVFLVIDEK